MTEPAPPTTGPSPSTESAASETPSTASLARAHAAAALSIGTSLSFFITGVAPLPVLYYFPLSRRFGFYPGTGELSMDFFGRALLALLCGTAAGLLVYLWASSAGRPHSTATGAGRDDRAAAAAHDPPHAPDRSTRLWLLVAYTATAALLAASLFAYQLSARIPTPEPLPARLSSVQPSGSAPPNARRDGRLPSSGSDCSGANG